MVRTNKHRKDQSQYRRNVVVYLPYSTNSAIEISKFATDALKRMWRDGYSYKKAGVIVTEITPIGKEQVNLFENSNARHAELMLTIDRINSSIGQHKIKLASQDTKRTWQMKQDRLSPKYTTKLSDILVVNAND